MTDSTVPAANTGTPEIRTDDFPKWYEEYRERATKDGGEAHALYVGETRAQFEERIASYDAGDDANPEAGTVTPDPNSPIPGVVGTITPGGDSDGGNGDSGGDKPDPGDVTVYIVGRRLECNDQIYYPGDSFIANDLPDENLRALIRQNWITPAKAD